jgi:hypothetical protein
MKAVVFLATEQPKVEQDCSLWYSVDEDVTAMAGSAEQDH